MMHLQNVDAATKNEDGEWSPGLVLFDGALPSGVEGTDDTKEIRKFQKARIKAGKVRYGIEAADGTPLAVFADPDMWTAAERKALLAASPVWGEVAEMKVA